MARGMIAALALACTACVATDAETADAVCRYDPPVCRRNTLLSCDDAGATVETPCGEQRCAADAPRPLCVPAGALPCSTGDPPRCDNGLLQTCDPQTGYPAGSDCGAGQICVEHDARGACAAVGDVPCDPEGDVPLCVAGRRVQCDPRTRHLREAGPC
jgi:hypothetical protein